MPKTLAIRVTPKAKQARVVEVVQIDGTTLYKVYVAVPPEDGKANAAMLKAMAAHLGVPKTALTLVQGATSRDKVVACAMLLS